MSEEKKIIKVGSRKSELALTQTRYVISLLNKRFPQIDYQIVTMNTLGDQILDKPLSKIGEKSLFTKELEVALAAECIDFVVHSLKDLPTTLEDGMAIGAVLKREDPRDALVLKTGLNLNLSEMQEGSVIGTSSLRRTAQLVRRYPHLKIQNIRGNLNTRLKKLDELDTYSAIVLAKAGLVRMGWESRISKVFDCSEMLYAVGQGALAVECRHNDKKTIDMLATLHDPETLLRVVAERSFLKTLEGGCSAPVAVSTKAKDDNLKLTGAVWSLDGKISVLETDSCPYEISKDESGLLIGDIEDIKYVKNVILKPRGDGDVSSSSNVRKHEGENSEIKQKRVKSDNVENLLEKVSSSDSILKCPFSATLAPDNCPVSTLPVGVDFMGQCPYLDSKLPAFPIHGQLVPDEIRECPYSKKQCNPERCDSVSGCPFNKNNESSPRLYSGLIGSKFIAMDVLQKVENLGIRLAQHMIVQGAHDIMQEAQKHIRGTSHEINKVVLNQA